MIACLGPAYKADVGDHRRDRAVAGDLRYTHTREPDRVQRGPYRFFFFSREKRESTYTSFARAGRRSSGSTRQSNPQCRKASAPTSRERSSESSSDERRR